MRRINIALTLLFVVTGLSAQETDLENKNGKIGIYYSSFGD